MDPGVGVGVGWSNLVVVLFVICDVAGKQFLRVCGIPRVEALEGGKSQRLDQLISRRRDSAGTSRLGYDSYSSRLRAEPRQHHPWSIPLLGFPSPLLVCPVGLISQAFKLSM